MDVLYVQSHPPPHTSSSSPGFVTVVLSAEASHRGIPGILFSFFPFLLLSPDLALMLV